MKADPYQILMSKAKHLTREQIERLTVREAWELIYSLPPEHRPKDVRLTICFTGFAGPEEEPLIKLAEQNGLHVVQSVVKDLSMLCCGETPGPKKLEKAKAQGTRILLETQFRDEYDKPEEIQPPEE
jgi:NAD-dependent DNA ligase